MASRESKVLEKVEHLLNHILHLEENIDHRLRAIERRLPKPCPITRNVENIFTGESIMASNALVFTALGQTSIDTLTPFLADGVTLSGGVVSNVVVTFADPSASFVVNPDNTVTFTAVAASTSPVSGSTACTITDTDSVVSTWNIPFTVFVNVVTPPPPAQLTQSVSNIFSIPTP